MFGGPARMFPRAPLWLSAGLSVMMMMNFVLRTVCSLYFKLDPDDVSF